MYCEHCGKYISENYKYCSGCGKPIRNISQQTEKPNKWQNINSNPRNYNCAPQGHRLASSFLKSILITIHSAINGFLQKNNEFKVE